eukprot:scaffold5843_cov125-Isochrysis_galbana.AAC.8
MKRREVQAGCSSAGAASAARPDASARGAGASTPIGVRHGSGTQRAAGLPHLLAAVPPAPASPRAAPPTVHTQGRRAGASQRRGVGARQTGSAAGSVCAPPSRPTLSARARRPRAAAWPPPPGRGHLLLQLVNDVLLLLLEQILEVHLRGGGELLNLPEGHHGDGQAHLLLLYFL